MKLRVGDSSDFYAVPSMASVFMVPHSLPDILIDKIVLLELDFNFATSGIIWHMICDKLLVVKGVIAKYK